MSDGPRFVALSFTVALALAGVVVLLWSLGGGTLSAHADSPHYVAIDCMDVPAPCHTTVQAAVDAADPGDEICVAAGTYTDVQRRPAPVGYNGPSVITQVVYISKTVTIRGGYTTTNWTTSYPITQPTTLDAQGRGRVIVIAGYISPTIEGLHITSGDATGLDGGWSRDDAGGGVFVINATATISNNRVFSNTAYQGGGLWLYSSPATLGGNTVISNTAYYGGGISLYRSATALSGNAVISNTAWNGGGLYLYDSPATLSGNTVISNTAWLRAGGLYLYDSPATLNGNIVMSNIVHGTAPNGGGGGLLLVYSDATLSGNTVISNTAYYGGGINLYDSAATLSGNAVISNTAWNGGGLCLAESAATLSGDTVMSNTALEGGGGGLQLWKSDAILTNTVVTDNQAVSVGSGLRIAASSPHLLHTTIARNSGGDGSGVYVTEDSSGRYGTVVMTNTILVSHSVGISVTGGSTVTVNGILWYGTPITVSQATTATVTVQNQHQGAPRFAADGYHLRLGSAAIDKGVDTGVTTDIDGDSRPQGSAPDLGADEFGSGSGPGGDTYLPLILKNASP